MEVIMNINKISAIRLFLVIAFFATEPTFASLKLIIPTIGQAGANTCWAATCRMVLAAYGSPQSEQTLKDYATKGKDTANYLYGDL